MIDQSRAISSARITKHLGDLPRPILREVEDKLRTLAQLS
jgi:mRNA-degrading endonuclease toxin of MazEF toxin-antitoxin module